MILLFVKARIKKELHACGFDLAGIAAAEPLHDDFGRFEEWLDRGSAGAMDYLERRRALRLDPASLLPGARSVIVAAAAYPPVTPPGPLAAYAVCLDYHDLVRSRLEAVVAAIGPLVPAARFRISVDTAPIMERALAGRAGIGWIGQSTSLVTERFGPYVLLGEIVTDLALEPDTPHPPQCGDCGKCLEACPTGALEAPFRLDARRCISYLTIEKRGDFNSDEAAMMTAARGDCGRVFGCDLCLAVCPHAKAAIASAPAAAGDRILAPLPELAAADLDALETLCKQSFRKHFGKTPIARVGKKGLLRNLAAARAPCGE
jgi:epoxyqueuosine reductase